MIILKFQGFGGLGGHGQHAVCPVALGSRLEGESVTPRRLNMVGYRVRETRHTRGPAALSLVLLMVIGHPGNPGVNAGLLIVTFVVIIIFLNEQNVKIYIFPTYSSCMWKPTNIELQTKVSIHFTLKLQ